MKLNHNIVGWLFITFLLLLPVVVFLLTGDIRVLWLFYGLYGLSFLFLLIAAYLSHKVYQSGFYSYAHGVWGSFNREVTNELKKYEWRR